MLLVKYGSVGVSRELKQKAPDIQHCFQAYQTTQLEKMAKTSISVTPKVIEAPFEKKQINIVEYIILHYTHTSLLIYRTYNNPSYVWLYTMIMVTCIISGPANYCVVHLVLVQPARRALSGLWASWRASLQAVTPKWHIHHHPPSEYELISR